MEQSTQSIVVAQDQLSFRNLDSTELNRKIRLAGPSLAWRREEHPEIPVVTHTSEQWLTRRRWYRDHDRKVLPHQAPRAILLWEHNRRVGRATQHPDTGQLEWEFRKRTVVDPLLVYSIDQTKPVRKKPRTKALEAYWKLFGEPSHPDVRVPYLPGIGPRTWQGKFTEEEMREHLSGTSEFALRMGKLTRSVGIDLDLHGGDFEVFCQQLQVLLDTFWGQATWHLQVKEREAAGIHLLFITRSLSPTESVAGSLRELLCNLDSQHPQLASVAQSAGMKPFSKIEVKPTRSEALRAPLAKGRTMLLDRPLTPVPYRGQMVADVVGYINWIDQAISGTARWMPKNEAMHYVISRLVTNEEKKRKKEAPIIVPPRSSPISCRMEIPRKTAAKSRHKGMKNRSWILLTEAWSGQMEADSLNHWIRQLSLYSPFRFPEEELAVLAIESFIDDLPCHAFSDRLIGGERERVSAVVRRDVALAFAGWPDQPDPEKSARKLRAVWEKWSSTGRDPYDRTTWSRNSTADGLDAVQLAPDFGWNDRELAQLEHIAGKLKATVKQTAGAVKRLARVIRVHPEVPRTWIVRLLEQQGIRAKSKKLDKPKVLIETLVELEWIWIPRKHLSGRCRRFSLGLLRKKFPEAEVEQDCSADRFKPWSDRVVQLEQTVAEQYPWLSSRSYRAPASST